VATHSRLLPSWADNFINLSSCSGLLSHFAFPQVSLSRKIGSSPFKSQTLSSPSERIVARSGENPVIPAPPSPLSSLHQQPPAFPQRSDSQVGASLPPSPIWVVASRAQALGRLLVEPTDVMGHRFPV
jgi:hypothetical protein